jgi:hypothetical protein
VKARGSIARSGGTTRTGGTRYVGAPGRRAETNQLFARRPQGSPGDGPCPTCRRTVPLRKDGDVVGHRIGRSLRMAWPCPGADVPVATP